ncbi:kinase-like domain, phloem protein 2-like protein [Tanacetum coccineum]
MVVRRLNKEKDEHWFWMEISMLSTLKHKNLVSLVGFCDENDEKIIIIKDESRGSLNNYLSYPMLLTWVRRLEICVGLAHALSYIHYDESRDFSVIHRNLCSGIILLNDDWEPKLSNFRHAMKIKASQRHHSFHTNSETKRVSHKSDIYSFGIVLFELLCGNDHNRREKILNEIIDWGLWKQMDSQSFDMFAYTMHDCLNEEQSQRPNIDEIVTRLEKALELQLEHQKSIMSLPSNEFAHLRVPLEDILSATNNFDDKRAILTSESE